MLLRTTFLAAAFAALSATPASAQDPPALDAVKPCYVAAQETQREFVTVSGHDFTPFGYVDVYIDDIAQPGVGDPPQADVYGEPVGRRPGAVRRGRRAHVHAARGRARQPGDLRHRHLAR